MSPDLNETISYWIGAVATDGSTSGIAFNAILEAVSEALQEAARQNPHFEPGPDRKTPDSNDLSSRAGQASSGGPTEGQTE
jgi:hypothetical protein